MKKRRFVDFKPVMTSELPPVYGILSTHVQRTIDMKAFMYSHWYLSSWFPIFDPIDTDPFIFGVGDKGTNEAVKLLNLVYITMQQRDNISVEHLRQLTLLFKDFSSENKLMDHPIKAPSDDEMEEMCTTHKTHNMFESTSRVILYNFAHSIHDFILSRKLPNKQSVTGCHRDIKKWIAQNRRSSKGRVCMWETPL